MQRRGCAGTGPLKAVGAAAGAARPPGGLSRYHPEHPAPGSTPSGGSEEEPAARQAARAGSALNRSRNATSSGSPCVGHPGGLQRQRRQPGGPSQREGLHPAVRYSRGVRGCGGWREDAEPPPVWRPWDPAALTLRVGRGFGSWWEPWGPRGTESSGVDAWGGSWRLGRVPPSSDPAAMPRSGCVTLLGGDRPDHPPRAGMAGIRLVAGRPVDSEDGRQRDVTRRLLNLPAVRGRADTVSPAT